MQRPGRYRKKKGSGDQDHFVVSSMFADLFGDEDEAYEVTDDTPTTITKVRMLVYDFDFENLLKICYFLDSRTSRGESTR